MQPNTSNPGSSHYGQGLFYGWIILTAIFLSSMIVWGFYYSISVFFSELQKTFSANRADISLIPSIFIFTLYITGFIYGWAIDKYSPRIIVFISGLLVFTGLFLSSYASSLWQLYVLVGFVAGFGTGATFVPYVSILSRWFVKRRGLAIGLWAAGSGTGMMIIPPISQILLENVGWRVAFIYLSIANLIIFCLAAYLVRRRPEDKGLRPYGLAVSQAQNDLREKARVQNPRAVITDSSDMTFSEAFRGKDIWLLVGMRIFLSLTIFMVNVHLVNFGNDAGLTLASAAFLITIVGGASIFGKIGSGYLVDQIGSKKIIVAFAALMVGVLLWLSSPMGSLLLQLSALIYGIAYGGSYALFNTVIAETFGTSLVGKILGVVNIGSAVGSLLGPWLAGYIFDSTGSYSIAFLTGAISSVVAIILTFPLGKAIKQPGEKIN